MPTETTAKPPLTKAQIRALKGGGGPTATMEALKRMGIIYSDNGILRLTPLGLETMKAAGATNV